MKCEAVPTMVYTDESLKVSLAYWKKALFLDDWIIHIERIPMSESPLNNKDIGHVEFTVVEKSALISIAMTDKYVDKYVSRICEEKILVHELLHLKYPTIENNSFESAFMDIHNHAILEQMSKTLMMVKYDVPFEWFDSEYKLV